ncbi:hypothetical protein AB2B38_012685 [Balneola sp. MJW-20]|uniref:hypothetical protein n=1 Tax=Gracilimonas aurantiaca TaxID=3234185 RepID=UPI003464EA03
MQKILFLILSITLCAVTATSAQVTNFGDYANYTLTLDASTADLDFGTVTNQGGTYNIPLNMTNVIRITGVKYLDVIVEVTGEPYLYYQGNPANAGDPSRRLPFTLNLAYANNAGTPSIANAKFVTGSNNYFLTTFPMLARQGRPPGPPPAPPTKNFDQSVVNETAYLFFYGSINVGNVFAGPYESSITVTVNYD